MWAIRTMHRKVPCFITGELHTSEGSATNRAKELTQRYGSIYESVEVSQEEAEMIRQDDSND